MNPRQSSQPSSDSSPSLDVQGPASKRARRRKTTRSKRPSNRRLTVEGLERRQLLAANSIGAFSNIDEYDGPRNVGSATAFTYNEREDSGEFGENDSRFTSELVPLGNASGQRDTVNVVGSVGFEVGNAGGFVTDLDFYSFDLQAGDILDIAGYGAVSSFQLYMPNDLSDAPLEAQSLAGQVWISQDGPAAVDDPRISDFYPIDSPLQTLGNVNLAQVVPYDGIYTIGVSAQTINSSYTLGLRTYRPVTESLGSGQSQIVYLDYGGGVVARDEFNTSLAEPGVFQGGVFVIPPITQTLEDAGLIATPDRYIEVTDYITETVMEQFADLENYTGNGSYDSTFNPGDFGISILNSYTDQAEYLSLVSAGVPVTRVVFGSVTSFEGITDPPLGIAQTIDIGNFDLGETVLVFVDSEVAAADAVTHSAAFSDFEVLGLELGATTSHELGHVFGLLHTNGGNLTASLIDGAGDNELNGLGVGVDGVLGTIDDITPRFVTDFVDPGGGITYGRLFSGESLAHSLSTGTSGGGGGGSVVGTVYNDANGNGSFVGDSGLSGVTVFLDLDSDGVQDTGEPATLSGADGTYSLTGPQGTYTLIAVTPSNLSTSGTLTTSQTITIGQSAVTANFGFSQIAPDISGFKFSDANSDGVFNTGDSGVAGAYIYADLDGDNRPDLFEPYDITDENGAYSLSIPSTSIGQTFAVREVELPGFQATLPVGGEHIVSYTGSPLTGTYDFGGNPSRDFGDAPDTYLTSSSVGGASHGIDSRIQIGASIDSEIDGAPSTDALGDDVVNFSTGAIDDEDGVVELRPINLVSSGQFNVSLTNTSGSTGYLQAWVDFNADGDFTDFGEQVVTNGIYGTGTATIDVPLPAGFDAASVTANGSLSTYARFRYSLTPGLGAGGAADTGEVEDYQIRILESDQLANDDTNVQVPRNSSNFLIDVLANDLNATDNPLIITSATSSVAGSLVTIGAGAAGQQTLLYTPASDYTGLDTITYFVVDQNGNTDSATVSLNVVFQSANPIAVDDIYQIESNETGIPLNVLSNDVQSTNGTLSITSFTQGSQGGVVTTTTGQQGLRYTPASGNTVSEQFTYTVIDSAGVTSTANVTVILTPESAANDKASFKIEILDQNNDTELLTLQAGQTFRVRISVDDIASADSDLVQGVQSAYTDLLYTSELVTPVDTDPSDAFPFDITFGPKFATPSFSLGNTLTPGLYDEIGATQSTINLDTIGTSDDLASHTGFTELFTLTMQATGTGLALFQTDPTEAAVAETILIPEDGVLPTALAFDEIEYDSRTIEIVPAGSGLPVALDDSYPAGGQAISGSSTVILDVLANDAQIGSSTITDIQIQSAPANGSIAISTNGTTDPSDDKVLYTPTSGFTGYDEFSYSITVQSDSFGTVSSIANVSVVTGQIANPQAQYDFTFVDEDGNEITQIATGERFGLRIDAIDLDDFGNATTDAVFAGFLDILYNSSLIETIAVDNGGDPNLFDFDVEFDPQFLLSSAVGSADYPGIVDEFGSNKSGTGGSGTELATVYFRALQTGTATVTGSPADRSPFQDTLLDNVDTPVPVENILYDSESILITSGSSTTGSGEPLHNNAIPADVNGDNLVTAIDALLVINEMSRMHAEGESASASVARPYYHDVNGDGYVSAIDALRVINQLNTSNVASSEPLAAAPVANATTNADRVLDESIESLAQDAKIVGGASSVEDASIVSVASDSSASTDDDDDLLSLLADDISQQ
ncbi:Ig-like domain-containing protein [Neorhodopirellula lusitana]|uniref:Ig-like domain-containing protein n=1 Tax=Neorhodopirellula lusitana TaxID=445327 RepID=UPI00384FB53D